MPLVIHGEKNETILLWHFIIYLILEMGVQILVKIFYFAHFLSI